MVNAIESNSLLVIDNNKKGDTSSSSISSSSSSTLSNLNVPLIPPTTLNLNINSSINNSNSNNNKITCLNSGLSSPSICSSSSSSVSSHSTNSPPQLITNNTSSSSSSNLIYNRNTHINDNKPSIVYIYVELGKVFQFQVGDEIKEIHGPATIKMISNETEPIPFHLQAPVGHLVQHINQNDLTHIVLSQQQQQQQQQQFNQSSHSNLLQQQHHHHAPYIQSQSLKISIPPATTCTNLPYNHLNHHIYNLPQPNNKDIIIEDYFNNKRRFKPTKKYNSINDFTFNNNNRNKFKCDFNTDEEFVDKLKKSKSSNDMDLENKLREELSTIKPVELLNIDARSVLVRLTQPELKQNSLLLLDNLNYTLEIKVINGFYHKINCGDANEVQIKDLKPFTDYLLRVYATLNGISGEPSIDIKFKTKACEPDRPSVPKEYGTRKKNEINLRWNTPNENGSKIINYLLECDFSLTNEFNEIYRGPLKQFTLKKLKPSTTYAFRLAAENSFGLSVYSDIVQFLTSGCVPQIPAIPHIIDKKHDCLIFEWNKQSIDDEIELQMLQDDNHNFLTVYNGIDNTCTLNNLKSNYKYEFRIRARNQEGYSNWSDIFSFTTNPDRPQCPLNLHISKAYLTPYSCKIEWEEPKFNGGSKIIKYLIDIKNFIDTNDKYNFSINNNNECEYLFDNLKPGNTYETRVACMNDANLSSDYSSKCIFTCLPVVPGQCDSPKLANSKILKSNSIKLHWNEPLYNGGSNIISYELQMIDCELNTNKIVYKGRDNECLVASLAPGQTYLFQVRASNKIGYGEWSKSLDFLSGPGIPDAPQAPSLTIKSSHCVYISWFEPIKTNGAPINDYKLEYSLNENDNFVQIYNGPLNNFEFKSLIPNTNYYFRLQACNIAGWSMFSQLSSCLTPPSVPSQIQNVKIVEFDSTSVLISWKIPNSFGSPINSYIIDLGEKFLKHVPHGDINEFRVDNLTPDTQYKLRIQAINSIGSGQFSPSLKFKTKIAPPNIPRLECLSVTHNSLKLKFSDNKQIDYQLVYTLELRSKNENHQFTEIFKGCANYFKINKLNENTIYMVRICASNESGTSDWSNEYEYKTAKSPPLQPECPFIELTQNSCLVNWKRSKLLSQNNESNEDRVEYILQMKDNQNNDFKEFYRGDCTSFRFNDLALNCEYNVRVCAVRVCADDGLRIQSTFSGCTLFNTHIKQNLNDNYSNQASNKPNKSLNIRQTFKMKIRNLTDKEWATFILALFAFGAIIFAIVAHQLYSLYFANEAYILND